MGFWAGGQLDVKQYLWWDRILLDQANIACITQESTFQECENFWRYCHIQIHIPV